MKTDAGDDGVLVHPPNPTLEKMARLVLRFRWLVLAATVLGTIAVAAYAGQTLRADTSIEAFVAEESATQRVLEVYRDDFGRDDVYALLIAGDVFSRPYLERLQALHQELEGLDLEVTSLGERKSDREAKRTGAAPAATPPPADDFGFEGDDGWGAEAGGSIVEEITSLINVRQTRATPDRQGIVVGELMDPLPAASELPALKARVLADDFLVGQVVGQAAKHSVVVVRTQFMNEEDSLKVNSAVLEIMEKHQAPGFELSAVGLPALNAELNELMLGDLGRLAFLSALALALLMGFIFRHPLGVIGPLLVVAMAVVSTFGFMAAAGMTITMLCTILPAFVSCVGIGDSVHLLSVYRDYLRDGLERDEALVQAIATTGTPILYTSITTMVGLLSFRFASLTAIQDMGTAGAIGVFMAMVHSLFFLPALVSFARKTSLGAKPAGTKDFLDRFLGVCLGASGAADDDGTGPEQAGALRRRRNTLVAGVLLLGVAGFGMTLLVVYHNPFAWVPDGTPIKTAFETMDEEIGGTSNVQLLITASTERGLKDKALLEGLDRLRTHVQAFEHPEKGTLVGNAISILEIIKETNRALHGGDPEHYRIPETQGAINDNVFLFTNAGPDKLRRFATTDLSRGQMTIRIKWLDATGYRPLTQHVDAGIRTLIPPESGRVEATGSVYTLVTTVDRIIGDLILSFGTAFVIISLLMVLMLRGVKLGLVAMVPNLMPIVMIMGLMGYVGIPIDLNNLLIASIAIGVAVDDTIHFLHHFRVIHAHTGNVEQAVRRAASHSGRAMASTTLVLMVGFFVYQGSQMANIQRFGLLIGLTCLMALLIDLVFAPALLRTLYRRDAPESEEERANADLQTA